MMGKLPIIFLRLLLDPKIPFKYKLLPAIGIAYVILPFDIIPDMFPLFGFIDDILVLIGSVILFMIFGPIGKFTRTLKNSDNRKGQKPDKDIVEGEYRIIEENNDTNRTKNQEDDMV